MQSEIEESVNEAYKKFLDIMLYDVSLEQLDDLVESDVMGYGTTMDEKILEIKRLRKLVIDQREQSVGYDINFVVHPVHRRISPNEDSAIFVDEIEITMSLNDEKNVIPLRFSTVLEFIGGSWKVVHLHGSVAVNTEGDTWHKDEHRKKLEELQKLVSEKTKDLISKNRELEIETALEKVRTIAMGMRDPSDMLDVCSTISLQLESLGVKEIRDVQTAIFYEHRGTYMNYEYYTKHKKTFITETTYTNNEIHNEFALKMLKGKGETFITNINGKEVKDWIEYQKTTNVFIDKYLETASSLNYYWFSLGPVALGISTYHPLTKEEIILFKRFLRVFELAYRRYLDIERAEIQTREAKIETALERVRSRSLAMHESDELNEVVLTLCEQINMLQIDIDSVNINILNKSGTGFDSWFVAPGYSKALCLYTPYFKSLVMDDIFSAIKNKQNLFSKVYSKKDKNAYFSYLYKHSDYNNLPDERKKWILEAKQWCLSIGISGIVGISIHNYSGKTFSDDDHNILLRFTKVFYQSYRRFLDLQKAEAQAREAQIEAALEKVRSRTMAMQRSEELSETSFVLFQQFAELGVIPNRFFIGVLNEEEGIFDLWITEWGGTMYSQTFKGNLNEPLMWKKVYEAWKQKDRAIVIDIKGEDLLKWNEYLKSIDFPVSSRKSVSRIVNSCAIFSKGFISITTPEITTTETVQLLERFASVFDGTYTRFLDLKQAEAQAREAHIEASLERVRANAMAMHSSEDLSDTVNVFFKELKLLGIVPIRCGVGKIDEETRTTDLTTTTSSQQGDSFKVIGKVKQTGHPVLDGIYDHWKLQKEYHPVLKGEDMKAYYSVMNPQIGYPEYPENVTQFGNLFYFKEGFVFAWTEKKLSEEELKIFRRFTSVLSLTYRRYMDLKEAEAQAREAKIESSLERVRAKTMAMHQSNELAETAAVVFKQLIILGIEPNRIYIAIIKDETSNCEFWITDEDGSKVSSGFKANLNDNRSFQKMYEGWKEKKKSITIDMKGKELQEYFQHLNKLGVPFKGGFSQKRRMQYIAYFSKGFIGVASPDETNPETIQLLERFAAVFNLTYTRFNDLQQAEAHNKIIQAENERKTKELEEARQLQLAMLPKVIPQLPNLDIAVYMQTATEVGGDYYDFQVGLDGTLTTIIGDATGHGLKAGTVVTITKSLFNSMTANENILATFDKISQVIKGMKFRQLAMCLLMMKIRRNRLSISSAGMPPALIYRAHSKTVEEIFLKGMPLGTMRKFPYKKIESHLYSGDRILLYSDGLPELGNDKGQMFGYDRIVTEYQSIGEREPEEIVEHLKNSTSRWANCKEPDDDVTFVVIKVK